MSMKTAQGKKFQNNNGSTKRGAQSKQKPNEQK